MVDSGVWRILLLVIAAAALIALLAYARGNPGDDGRWPDRDSFVSAHAAEA